MTPRTIRRAAERKAKKLIRKQTKAGTYITQETTNQPLDFSAEDLAIMRQMEEEIVRDETPCSPYLQTLAELEPPASATPRTKRRYTGPATDQGKAISSLNRLKHGLTGTFRVLPSESQFEFEELCETLRKEHAPATPTENLLVDRMAEHVWLSQRAQGLQDDALSEKDEKSFALYLRYQTTNDRGFYRCLRELVTLRRERRQFESQNRKAAAPDATVADSSLGRVQPLTSSSAVAASFYSTLDNHSQFESQNGLLRESRSTLTTTAAPTY